MSTLEAISKSIKPLSKTSLLEVTNNNYLTDEHINKFHEIVAYHTNYDPQDVLFIAAPCHITPVMGNHIQIMPQNYNTDPNSVGHWICLYYDGTNAHIYDSLNTNVIKPQQQIYIERLFPHNPRIVFHSVGRQPNMIDCGVYAIAMAVTLIMGKDPSEITYDHSKMREILYKILTENRLIEFPEINFDIPILNITKTISKSKDIKTSLGRPKKKTKGRPKTTQLTRKEQNKQSKAKYQALKPEKHRKSAAKYQAFNAEKHRKSVAKYQALKPEKHRASKRKFQAGNLEAHKRAKSISYFNSKINNSINIKNEEKRIYLKKSLLDKDVHRCKHCKAALFDEEMTRKEWCCGTGRYHNQPLPVLKNDFYDNDIFKKHYRGYNNLFAFSALGVSSDNSALSKGF